MRLSALAEGENRSEVNNSKAAFFIVDYEVIGAAKKI